MLVGSAPLAVGPPTETLAVTGHGSLSWPSSTPRWSPGLAATWSGSCWSTASARCKAATFHFLNPFFGVADRRGLLGEALGPLDVLGVAIIAGHPCGAAVQGPAGRDAPDGACERLKPSFGDRRRACGHVSPPWT
jgi:hypothetical protein